MNKQLRILTFIFLLIFLISFVNATQKYVLNEIVSTSECDASTFTEASTFKNSLNITIYHCISKSEFNQDDLFVTDSILQSDPNCLNGYENPTSFQINSSNSAYLCVKREVNPAQNNLTLDV